MKRFLMLLVVVVTPILGTEKTKITGLLGDLTHGRRCTTSEDCVPGSGETCCSDGRCAIACDSH